MQFSGATKAARRLACKWPMRFGGRPVPEAAGLSLRLFPLVKALLVLLWFCSHCAPSRDTVMRDVERNYINTGFLDTDTFQVRCPLDAEGDRLDRCKKKLVAELIAFKEGYDRTTYARRNHPDFQPFLKPIEVSDEQRSEWGSFYAELSRDRARLVYEARAANGELFEGVYRLRLKDLIYRVQNVR